MVSLIIFVVVVWSIISNPNILNIVEPLAKNVYVETPFIVNVYFPVMLENTMSMSIELFKNCWITSAFNVLMS